MSRLISVSRFSALLFKEFIQMRRDRITFAMMLVVPLMQLVLFGYAINSDPKSLPSALVTITHDRYSRALVTSLELTGYFSFDYLVDTASDAEALMASGKVAFIVTVPPDLAARIDRGRPAEVLVEADATDPAAASGALAALDRVAETALLRARGGSAETTSEPPLTIVIHRRYNPEGISQFNIVPRLLGVILQMTMVMMTSIALTRETERGTMENLLAMPASPLEIMLGKVIPYLMVGAAQVAIVLVAARLLFGVPFLGSTALLLSAVLIFVLALVLLGYTISTVARTQMQALQLTFFFFLPSLLLSGFMFPFRGMPVWAQGIGEIFPLTHFLRITRAIMLKGAQWPEIATEILVLAVFVAVYAGLALRRFRRTLD